MTGRWSRIVVAAAVVVAGTAAMVGGSSGPSAADGTTTIAAEGGTFSSPIVDQLAKDAPASVNATYAELPGVDTARDDFAAGLNDFAVSEFPLTGAQTASAKQIGRTFAYVPVAAQAVAVGFEVFMSENQAGPNSAVVYPTLQISVPTLASLFTGRIDNWADPQIVQNGSGQPVNCTTCGIYQAVLTKFPAEPSAATSSFIQLLLDNPAAKSTWDEWAVRYESAPDTVSKQWPAGGGDGGDRALAETFHFLDPSTGLPDTNQQHVGYGDIGPIPMDWTIAPWNIPRISVQNAAGAYVAPTPASMAAALKDSQLDATTNLVSFPPDANDPAAYALPAMSYLVVPTSGLSPAKATALATFIRFAVSPAGQRDVVGLGGVAITPAMEAAGLKVADQVAAEAGPPPASTPVAGTPTGDNGTAIAPRTAPAIPPSSAATPSAVTGGAVSAPSTPGEDLPSDGVGSVVALPELANPATTAGPIALAARIPLPVPLVIVGALLLLVGAVIRWRPLLKSVVRRGFPTRNP